MQRLEFSGAVRPLKGSLRVKWLNKDFFVCFWRDSPAVGQGLLIHEVSRSHTATNHSR